MKKILSLFSVMTLSGTVIPTTTIVDSSYQKQENKLESIEINSLQTNILGKLNRSKRQNSGLVNLGYVNLSEIFNNTSSYNTGNWIEASWDDLFVSFTPELWEEIKEKYNYHYILTNFKIWFRNRMNAADVWKDESSYNIHDEALEGIAKNIWENWSIYNNVWENSNRRKRLRIKIAWDNDYSYRSANIRTDDNYYPNKYLKPDLPDLITAFKKCIGSVDDTSDATILNAVQEKNPNLDISQVYVKQKVKGGRLELGVKSNSNKYNTNNTAWCDNFTVKPDLFDVITNTQLGDLNDNNDSTILAAVKDKNNLYNLEYTIRNKTENSAEFWINDDNIHYKKWSWKKVYFTVKQPISDVITTIYLGALNDNSESTIIDAVKSKNYNLEISEVSISQISNTSADIDAKYYSSKYKNYQKVYFTVKQPISDVITATQLGSLNDNNKDTILNAVFEKNPNLKISEIEITNITNTNVIISAKNNSNNYKSQVDIHFFIKKDLKDFIKITNLGDL